MKLTTLILLLFQVNSFSQNIKNFIVKNTNEIKSISFLDNNYTGFENIDDAILNAQIVMLGEQSHGDGSSFLAKAKIIKYLHERKGFNVIAFESDFFALNNCEKNNFDKNLYDIWQKAFETQQLFQYIKQNKKIKITGFDVRHASLFSKKNYINEFELFLTENTNLINTDEYKTFKPILNELIKKEYDSKNVKKKLIFENFITQIKSDILKDNSLKNSFWLQELENLVSFSKNSWSKGKTTELRDKQMAKNFIWLIKNKYPNEKIIVWAHNGHIGQSWKRKEKEPMFGYFIKKEFKEKVYSIGLNSLKGNYNWNFETQININKTKKNSFETWIDIKNFDYSFINFKNFKQKNEPFLMRGFGYYYNKTDWANQFDGIFFIEQMQSSNRLEK